MKLSQFSLEINLFLFFFILVLAILVGLLYKRKQILQLSDKIYDTEKELMKVNNELLAQIETNLEMKKEIDSLRNNTSVSSPENDDKVKDIRLGKIG
jgi:cell division protein FtsL